MTVTAFPVIGKKKSLDICLAFVHGCGGKIGTTFRGGQTFFYGVDESNADAFDDAKASGEPWYYCDNSYFDSSRQQYFRITTNRLQHSGNGVSDGKRFAELGIEIAPWRSAGEHIVLCPQSDSFMRNLAGYPGDWTEDSMRALGEATRRPVIVRGWTPNKGVASSTLAADLEGAHALMTWSSAAAITAILAGVPAIVGSRDCAAWVMTEGASGIENLVTPPDRLRWASVLADNQFTLDEMRNGFAWKQLLAQAGKNIATT